MTTMAIGVTVGLVGPHGIDGEWLASTAAAMDQQPSAGVSAAADNVMRVHESCNADHVQDLTALFLNPDCRSNKPHARHGARAANRVATVILGRKDATPEPLETPMPVALAAIEPSQVAAGVTASGAERSSNVMRSQLERPAPPPKKLKLKAAVPIALTPPAGEGSRQNAMVNTTTFNAYAPTPKFGGQPFGPDGDPFRSIAPQSSFDARFGRSW